MFIALLLSLSLWARPPVLVISDIDDTLKISRIISRGHKTDQIHQLLFETDAFSGSSRLFNQLKRAGAKIVYVTAAPKQVALIQKQFLRANHFPDTKNLILKKSTGIDTYTYKVSVVLNLIANHPEHEVLLLGDNAEKDIAAYETVTSHFSKRTITTFIHELYVGAPAAKVAQSQIPFLTYAEVATYLEKMGLVHRKVTQQIVDEAIADLSEPKRAELALPVFVELKKKDLERLESSLPYPLTELFKQLASRLLRREHDIINI